MIRPALLLMVMVFVLWPRPAAAIPVFAHRYGLTCQACHTEVPHLTAFGEAFLDHGYRLQGTRPKAAFPAAVKVELAYGSEKEGSLPKAIVDEVEVLVGGSMGSRGSYFAEHYLVDGGTPGRPRDLWASWRVTPDEARLPIGIRAGQFTLPLPVDPETFRETTEHYAIYDQTAGANPFTFFAPKIGAMVTFGGASEGTSASAALLKGHDTGSGIPAYGLDRALLVQHAGRRTTFSAYRYDGTRPVDGEKDRFWRQGYGIALSASRLQLDLVYQHGFDAHASPDGALRSSGGFAQLRYALTSRMFGIARYDGTQDTEFARSLTGGLGYAVARNVRFTVFDTIRRNAGTGTARNALSTQLLFAY